MEANIGDLVFYFDETNAELFIKNTSNTDEEELTTSDLFTVTRNATTSLIEIASTTSVPTGWEGPIAINVPTSNWNYPLQFGEAKVPYLRYKNEDPTDDIELFNPPSTEFYVIGTENMDYDDPNVVINTHFFTLTPTGIILKFEGDKLYVYYPKMVSGAYVNKKSVYTY